MFNGEVFGENFKSWRGARSLREVEKMLQISASTLSRIERGHTPDVDTFLTILLWTKLDPFDYVNDKAYRLFSKRWVDSKKSDVA